MESIEAVTSGWKQNPVMLAKLGLKHAKHAANLGCGGKA
jgi:hypothetical protein